MQYRNCSERRTFRVKQIGAEGGVLVPSAVHAARDTGADIAARCPYQYKVNHVVYGSAPGRVAAVRRIGGMDSFAPARSALAGLWLRPHSFRCDGSSHKICSVIFQELERSADSSTYLTCLHSCGRSDFLKGACGLLGNFRDFHSIHMGEYIFSTIVSMVSKVPIPNFGN